MTDQSMRAQMGSTLEDLFAIDPRLVLILADISAGSLQGVFEAYPGRCLNVGIMEQTAVSVAAGFALEGFVPVFHTIAPFAVERPFEQWKDDFSYQGLGGNVISIGASYDYGTDGATHHAPGDVPALLTIPRMEVVVPGTGSEFDTLFRQSYANGAPTYFRLSTEPNESGLPVTFGAIDLVRTGETATVVAVGPTLDRTLAAVEGLDVNVAYVTTVSPFDSAGLRRLAQPGPDGICRVVVVEPYLTGTLTSAIVSALSPAPVRIEAIGVPRETLSRYGSAAEHDAAVGLSSDAIRQRIQVFLDG